MRHSFTNKDLNLTVLMEECAELIQMCSKVKRFGIDGKEEQFIQEMADVLALINIVQGDYDIGVTALGKGMMAKEVKLEKFYDDV